jgi:16S rRNA (guanine(966)-N(2))-methyltransferase RsmD
MKILKGTLKGRNISCPPNIRPVSVRVRKSCFDILREEIEEAAVLDLFAGSGALGIEAVSCGASRATFIDIKKSCIETVKKNLITFKISSRARTYNKDAFKAIKDFAERDEVFDIIFIDPPYYKGMLIKTLQNLEEYDILAPSGFVIGFCYSKDEFFKESEKFSLIVRKNYGQTVLLIYRKQ